MGYEIYVLGESNITISNGGVLNGVSQGDGSHLVGLTIELDTNDWKGIQIADDDTDFRDNDRGQTLDGDQTVDGASHDDGTKVEAEYGFTVTDGVDTWTLVAFNVNDSSVSYSTVEGVAVIGGPGEFPPAGVPLTVTDAFDHPDFQASEYATPTCFVRGTLIETAQGDMPVEEITDGTQVWTLHDGFQPVRWRCHRLMPAAGRHAPICFAPGTIGNTRALLVSPQHRVRVSDWRTELFCAADAALVAAVDFVNDVDVTRRFGGFVEYHHIMFDRHQIVRSNGALTESFHPGAIGVAGLEDAAAAELFTIFPQLRTNLAAYGAAVHKALRGYEARVLVAGERKGRAGGPNRLFRC